jgi:quinol monooxygenase YgiN
MVIVAGHVTVDPEQREPYLAGSMSVVEKARQADGCLDFAITADLLDPGRVNLFERWESQEAVKTFRRRAHAWPRAPRSAENLVLAPMLAGSSPALGCEGGLAVLCALHGDIARDGDELVVGTGHD